MSDALPGLADLTPPADDFIKGLLTNALISDDDMVLPDRDAIHACKTNAEVEAVYEPWHRHLYSFLMHASLAHVLIRVSENHPNLAAGLAAEVEDFLDAGEAYPEWVWQWAEERGLDPEKIRSDAREDHQKWLETVPRHLQTGVPLDIPEDAPNE